MTRQANEPLLSLQRLVGMAPWNVEVGHGSFLTMEFGKECVEEFRGKSHIHGEWHLWLQCCVWRLEKGERILVASEDKKELLARTIRRLKFGPLVEANVETPGLDLRLTFESGIRLATFTINRYRYEQWELFRPDGRVLTAKAGGVLTEERAGGLA